MRINKKVNQDFKIIIVDDEYPVESILDPDKKILKGYESEMPSFRGILLDVDIEALLLYIMHLKY